MRIQDRKDVRAMGGPVRCFRALVHHATPFHEPLPRLVGVSRQFFDAILRDACVGFHEQDSGPLHVCLGINMAADDSLSGTRLRIP